MAQITAAEWLLMLNGARHNLRRRTSRGRESEQRASQVAENPDPTTLDDRVRRWAVNLSITCVQALRNSQGSRERMYYLVYFVRAG